MSNNEQQQKYSFRNLISKKEFEKLDLKEIEKFYIKKGIYLPIKKIKSKQFDSNGFIRHTYFGSYKFNPILIEEIYRWYFVERLYYIDTFYEINSIKLQISNSLEHINTLKLINDFLKKYNSYINKNSLFLDYFSHYNTNLDIKSENFINYIKDNLIHEESLIPDFITDHESLNLTDYYLFVELIKLESNFEVLDFLKAYKEKYLNNNSTTYQQQSNNGLTTNNENYFSRVFPSKIAENYLFKILDEYNVLKKDGTVDKGYQKYCDSFWRIGSSKKYKNVIFKLNAKKANYLEYLNKKYKANISETFKGKLTDGSKYDDDIIKLIDIYIKE